MRTRANIEVGMKPDHAKVAARQSFGDVDRVKTECCEISRSLPVDSTVWKMAMYITIAVLAGGTAFLTVNMPHHNFTGVLWQVVAIAVLARALIVGRRAISTKRFVGHGASDEFDTHGVAIAPHDEQGRTPVERMLN